MSVALSVKSTKLRRKSSENGDTALYLAVLVVSGPWLRFGKPHTGQKGVSLREQGDIAG